MTLLKPLDGSKKIKLNDFDPSDTGKVARLDAQEQTTKLLDELSDLQTLLYAAQQTPVLIVLQGMDTAGKDGTIRGLSAALNPLSCRVASFKVPTPLELAHDFLWRVHAETPGKGTLTIFNRSHYEDVLVARVHNLVPKPVWQARYDLINQFEELVASNGTIILKFFLQISNAEQERRLHEREQDPTKAWKLSPQDWKERELWDDYQAAYEDALNRCSAPHSPWYIVPADHKWYRNLAITEAIVSSLRPSKEGWLDKLKQVGTEEMKQLRAMRQQH